MTPAVINISAPHVGRRTDHI